MDWTAQTSTTTRQSQTLEPNALVYFVRNAYGFGKKNSMNNLENVKLDEMELAILSRNICQWNPSGLCWNDEEIGVSKSNKTSKHVCNNRYKHFWAHLWCFTELNCISYHIILVIPPIPFMNLHILWTILDRRQKCSIFSLDHKLNACSKCITYMSSWSPEMVVYR